MGDSLENFLSGGQSGAYRNEAQSFQNIIPQLQQNNSQSQSYLNPYNQAGQAAIPQYQDTLNKISNMSNGNWVQNYTQSPYAKMLTNNTLNSMNNAAAATGSLGSGANQTENGQVANQIASSDMQNFYNDQMGLNQQLLGGYSDMMGKGVGAAGQQGQMNSQLGANIATLLQEAAKANGQGEIAGQTGKESGLSGLLGGVGQMGNKGPGQGASSEADVIKYLFGG